MAVPKTFTLNSMCLIKGAFQSLFYLLTIKTLKILRGYAMP